MGDVGWSSPPPHEQQLHVDDESRRCLVNASTNTKRYVGVKKKTYSFFVPTFYRWRTQQQLLWFKWIEPIPCNGNWQFVCRASFQETKERKKKKKRGQKKKKKKKKKK